MPASSNYTIAVETPPKSFWQKLFFSRLNVEANIAAEAVAGESGGPHPSAFSGPSRIVIRDLDSGAEVWHVDEADLSGGTTAQQIFDDLGCDLEMMDVAAFRAKYGIAAS